LPKLVIAGIESVIMEDRNISEERQQQSTHTKPENRVPEARYAYYRRCQVFCKGGEQCKAPAENGSHICYAHAGQLAMAVRRERERRAVLAEAVAEMRRQGNPECEMSDLFTDFKGIQVTVAVMARAVIDGRIDCKTAGRLVVHLQTMSKLLWTLHKSKTLPLKDTDNTDLQSVAKNNPAANEREEARIILISPHTTVRHVDQDTGAQNRLEERGYRDRGQAHGPPKLRAA
jgi:hypothetical protein